MDRLLFFVPGSLCFQSLVVQAHFLILYCKSSSFMLLQISCGFWERANGRYLCNYRRFLKNDINGRPASSSGRHYNFPIRWLQGREYTRTPTHISGQTAVMCHFSIALTLLKLFPGGPEWLSFICLITYLIFVVKFFFAVTSSSSLQTCSCTRFCPD